MVSAVLNQPWIGRNISVTSSPDAALIGRSGLVVDETRETITMLENDREVIFGKSSIEFKIGDSDVAIDGKWYGSVLKIEYTVTKGVSDYDA